MMMQIHLHGLKFFAFHGFFDEERKLGNHFEVNADISYVPSLIPVKHIEQTINYVNVFGLIEKRMAVPTPLLETIATEIAVAVLADFPLAESVSLTIHKLTPPILNFQGKVGVSFTLNRS